MKRFHKIPLRLRLTILTALTLTIICVLLTRISVATATVTYGVSNINVNSQVNSQAGSSMPRDMRPTNSGIETLIKRANSHFTYASIVLMLIMILLGTIAAYFIAGRALKPVSDLSRKIENIDENKLFQPLEGFDTNDEVARLATSFNHMITKLAKSFNQQKQFASNAAHELKTPLAGIIANIEVLQLDENPTVQEYKEVIDDTLKNAQRLSDLVYDLLKMNSTLNIDHCESFDAKEMFEGIILSLSENIKAKNVRIENNIADIPLFGEKALLQRAFFNLVQNAVKYNKSNGKVEVSAYQNDDSVTVNIRDTGIGIPEKELDNIFDPFYRVDTSRSRETGGSGLGLSIVKSIIEKHKGKILVESEFGKFTKITVLLPKI